MNRREFLGCLTCVGVASVAGCATQSRTGKDGVPMSAAKTAVRPEDFSYCGIDCGTCDVFKATVHGDADALKRAHQRWTKTAQQHWGMSTLDPAILKCTGCRTEGENIFKGCRHCPIRRCAKDRRLASCGLCPEWTECKRLSGLLADEPQARRHLEQVAASATQP